MPALGSSTLGSSVAAPRAQGVMSSTVLVLTKTTTGLITGLPKPGASRG
jgi:hypothetical protein